jgi:hypothetical protein
MNQIDIVLSFDYELPLGGITKSFDHSLFNPTEKLLETADALKVPIVLFADILSHVRFKEKGVSGYYVPFENQIKKALQKGHDVQLHIHPHWLETEINDNNFVPATNFKLGDFAANKYPDNIEGIVEKSVKSLIGICKEGYDGYKCLAYRAGGYNLYPKTTEILRALYKNGIRIDSSISRGYYFKSDTSIVDYTEVPRLPNWYLPLDGNLEKAGSKESGLFEIPIASKPKGFFEMPTKFKLKKFQFRAVENRGPMVHTNENIKTLDKLKQLLSSRMLTIDNHTYETTYLMKILDYNVNRFRKHDKLTFSLIGHPKSLGAYHLKLLTGFVDSARIKYGSNIRFVTYRQIYDEMKMG